MSTPSDPTRYADTRGNVKAVGDVLRAIMLLQYIALALLAVLLVLTIYILTEVT